MRWIGQPEWPRERLWLWRLFFPLVRGIATTLLPADVEGREHLPSRGPYILVANHMTGLDPFWIEFALRERIRYMTKVEVLGYPFIGGVIRAIGNFPVRRGEADRRAIETALRVLDAGQPLGFFPEGTRSRIGRLRRAKPGIAFLARRSGAPLVPVGIRGTPGARLRFRPRREIVVRVGKPFTLQEIEGSAAMDDQALADAIMRRIAELLPHEMRGEYATVH